GLGLGRRVAWHRGCKSIPTNWARLPEGSGLQNQLIPCRRSTYCFRHTYATFRLTEGVDVYFLAKQMGTSVKMIEDHYGHITPVKNADRILLGLPGWHSNQAEITPGR